MSTRRTNRALSTTRRWTAGALLASTLAVGGIGLHLADAYAATPSSTPTPSSSSSPTSSPPTTSSSSTALGSSASTTGSTTTKGS